MEKLELEDFDQVLPEELTLAVLMEKQPSSHPWANFKYEALGVVVRAAGEEKSVRQVYQNGDIEHFLVTGLTLRLHVDQCESYYHNLMSPEPGCFIVANQPDSSDEMPVPYLVSLSFDEVHAYHEGDEQIYAVPIIPELYRWVEAYVLTHYVAIKKTKRKLKNWSDGERPATNPADEKS
ncbi:MAG: DUF3305 domain-containing protein [Gammaproteobacteria bacterium]|nr:DUF3305 domain-containing protein [Gammaproteobacteria bacterium]MDH3536462.1 DUF3305 domain-containing protein [Gammaproteobacteria bacterium]